jgi:hypothetical protein
MNTFEMNNVHKDVGNPQIKRTSPVVEVFSAMVHGRELPKFADANTADNAVKYIKELAGKAAIGDMSASAELNQIRREILEPAVLEEMKLLELFGGYQQLGAGDTIEREVWNVAGGAARIQALNGDVRVPMHAAVRYTVAPINISAGYQVDYRTLADGDASRENLAMQNVRTEMLNMATSYVAKVIYNSIKNASGVKYFAEAAGISQQSLDDVVKAVRRFGPTSILGAYAVVSQINNFVPYSNGSVTGISDAVMEEIRKNGLVMNYKGSIVRETPAPYDLTKLNAAGTDFETMLPEGLLYVLPGGVQAPVATWTVGGLTSFSGNDVSTGRVLTRFDLTVAADVARGQEYKIGLLNDTNITPANSMVL